MVEYDAKEFERLVVECHTANALVAERRALYESAGAAFDAACELEASARAALNNFVRQIADGV